MEFEGEYLFDKKWNGKGYDKDGNEIYKLINGKGINREYDHDSEILKYEGEYLNGKRNGKGKEFFHGKLIFDGIFLDGNRKKGKEFNKNGEIIFEGEYSN